MPFFNRAQIAAAVVIVLNSLLMIWIGRISVMAEAYELGLAVQCLGQTGYHWECEE